MHFPPHYQNLGQAVPVRWALPAKAVLAPGAKRPPAKVPKAQRKAAKRARKLAARQARAAAKAAKRARRAARRRPPGFIPRPGVPIPFTPTRTPTATPPISPPLRMPGGVPIMPDIAIDLQIPPGVRYTEDQIRDMLMRGRSETMERTGESDAGLPPAADLEERADQAAATTQYGIDVRAGVTPPPAPGAAPDWLVPAALAIGAFFLLGG